MQSFDVFKTPGYTILEMKKMGKRTGYLPVIDSERSPREAALKLPFRHIKQQAYVDSNKYKAEHCKRMRTINGVGNKRKLKGDHATHAKLWLNEWWQEAA